MSMGFHLDDIEESYFKDRYNFDDSPIGAHFKDDDKDNEDENKTPPIGAPFHD